MMRATVHVSLKPSVFDPQGEAVKNALGSLGLEGVQSVRIGKTIEIELDSSNPQQAQEKLDQLCRDLLSNPVIEQYELHWHS